MHAMVRGRWWKMKARRARRRCEGGEGLARMDSLGWMGCTPLMRSGDMYARVPQWVCAWASVFSRLFEMPKSDNFTKPETGRGNYRNRAVMSLAPRTSGVDQYIGWLQISMDRVPLFV